MCAADYAKESGTFVWKYARVELRPPSPKDFPLAIAEYSRLFKAGSAGRWRDIAVKDAFLNALVATEVACWFFLGEIIGKRSLVGYGRVDGAFLTVSWRFP
ncbi:unnamed protein product [Protopolystoma xenopodis]|uniref:ATP synthase subunit n=1 Tax=Protopolystoma xenopodis TaxID=117903 RepID=A0A3S5AJJ3_9PLAT|nr:unnamed protein product [Protopolystoma xenopodis]